MKEFKKFWISQSFSLIGNELTKFAIPVWLYQIYGTASSVAIGFAIISFSKVIMGPFAGVLVDNYPKKKILILAEVLQLVVIGLLLILIHFKYENIFLIYLLLGLSSLIDTVRFPAMMASIPIFVSKDELLKVNGIVSMTDSIANMGGPLLAGLIMVSTDIKGILISDIGTFLVSILILLFIKYPQQTSPLNKATTKKKGLFNTILFFKKNITETLTLIRNTKNAPLLLGTSFSMNFFIIGVFVLISPMFLFGKYSVSEISYVMSIIGVFQIGVGFLITRINIVNTLKTIYLGILVMGTFGYLTVAFSYNIIMTIIGLCFLLGSLPFINSCNRSLFQKIIPNEHHGRFFSTRRSISQSLTPLSALFSGFWVDSMPSRVLFGSKYQFVFFTYGICVITVGFLGLMVSNETSK